MPKSASPRKSRSSGSPEPIFVRNDLFSHGVREMFSWRAYERAYRPKDINWILNSILLVLVIIAILLFVRQFILIAVVLAVTFLVYVLATVPPEEIDYKITTEGIVLGDHNYIWSELLEFWFDEKYGYDLLVFETRLRFPNKLSIVLHDVDQEELQKFLVNYLPYREKPIQTWIDQLSRKVERKLSL